jgi:hypothetical protein
MVAGCFAANTTWNRGATTWTLIFDPSLQTMQRLVGASSIRKRSIPHEWKVLPILPY